MFIIIPKSCFRVGYIGTIFLNRKGSCITVFFTVMIYEDNSVKDIFGKHIVNVVTEEPFRMNGFKNSVEFVILNNITCLFNLKYIG